jgi:hypothetical protein
MQSAKFKMQTVRWLRHRRERRGDLQLIVACHMVFEFCILNLELHG